MTPRQTFDRLLGQLPAARAGSMFGYPALCLGRKPFAFFHADTQRHAAFKLPPELRERYLALDGCSAFDPSGGRPMRAWVQVPADRADLWPVLARSASSGQAAALRLQAAEKHLAESLAS